MAKYDEILMKFDRSQAKEDKLLIRIEKECRETIISRKNQLAKPKYQKHVSQK